MARLLVTAVLALAATVVAVAPSFGIASERAGTGALSRGSASGSLHNTPTPVPAPSDDPVEADTQEASPSPEAATSASPEPTASGEPERTPKPTPSFTPKPTPLPTTKPLPTPLPPLHESTWNALVRACLLEPAESEACSGALSASGVSFYDFKLRVGSRLELLAKLHAARAGEFEAYVKKCIASGSLESDACAAAWRLSGLPLAEFRARVAAKLAASKPSELEVWIRKCLDSHQLYGAECYHAWELSGLTSEEFDRRILAEWERR